MLPHVWLWRHCRQRPKSSSTPLQHFPVFDFSQLEPSEASVIQSERKWHRSSSLWSIIPGRCNNCLREILSVPNGLCQRCSTFPFFFYPSLQMERNRCLSVPCATLQLSGWVLLSLERRALQSPHFFFFYRFQTEHIIKIIFAALKCPFVTMNLHSYIFMHAPAFRGKG